MLLDQIHIEVSALATREQLETRLRLSIGMVAVIDDHIQELAENPMVNAAQIASRNRQKEAYESEQRTLLAQLALL